MRRMTPALWLTLALVGCSAGSTADVDASSVARLSVPSSPVIAPDLLTDPPGMQVETGAGGTGSTTTGSRPTGPPPMGSRRRTNPLWVPRSCPLA